MAKMTREDYLIEILNFIVNQASEDELDAVDAAIKQRGRKTSTSDLHFEPMAKQMIERFDFEMPDFHGMSRQMVKNIILENVEEIPAQDLEVLLDHYVPQKGQPQKSMEADLPPEALQSMIRQFIAFSIGAMSKEEDQKLRSTIPDWPERYWTMFSEPTKNWIRSTIQEHT